MFKDLFISYGRRESLSFVARLHQKLKLTAYEAWFDKVNIPDGEDYTARIHYGIESAHNFVYVMAARTLCSPYCLIELEYARFLGKRVIPINQAVIFQTENCLLSENEQQILRDFYRSHELIDPQIKTTQQVLERSLVLVGRTDWLDAKENISNQNCEELTSWAQSYENQWHKHESLEYLQTLELPQFGETIDSLDSVIERLSLVLERHKYYVSQHTLLTTQALDWARNQSLNHYLLVGKERQAAEEWLLVKFQEGEQAPCTPCDLLCDFIGESRKNAENRMTDCFICYDYADKETRNLVIKALARHAITTWRHDNDIQRGSKAEQAILSGIAGADNVLYFISPEALISEACNQELAHARELNKRIIPLLIKVTPNLPAELQQLQYLNFLEDQQHGFAELLRVLHIEHHYYEQHKMLLVRALEWRAGAFKTSFLLRGYNLENAKTWLRLNQQREQHPPTALHVEFITASEAAKERLGTEVFLSYSRKDGDFARKLNRALQESGKTVWFDQESISSGANFELELYKGIQNSDNFLFVISPDSATSPYCESEVNYAAQQGKRMVSVLCRETAPSSLPEVLKCINWIDFAQQDFDKQFPELIQTLELDREHAHQHTVLQQRANEWQENNCSNDFLLNISACGKAETWLKAATDKQPRATELQESYIQSSREEIEAAQRNEQRRKKIVVGSVLVSAIVIILAAFAWNKSEEAEIQKVEAYKQTKIAKKNYTKAKINNWVNIANKQIALGDYTRALRVAQEAYELNPNPQEPIPDVEQALSDAYNDVVLNRKGAFYKDSIPGDNITGQLIESPKGQLKLSFDEQSGIVQLINIEGKIIQELKHDAKITEVQWLDDGNFIWTKGKDNSVKLWDGKGVLIKTLLERKNCTKEETDIYCAPIEAPIEPVWLRDNKQLLIDIDTGESHKLFLWDMQGNLLKHQQVESYQPLIFSKNGQYFVSLSEGKSLQSKIAKFWRSDRIDLPPTVFISVACGKNMGCLFSGFTLTPDGQKLIAYTFQDSYIHIFTQRSKAPQILKKHKKPITALALAPDGKSFASGDSQGEIIIWNIDGQSQKTFLAQGGKVAITYSKDGKNLLTAHEDNTVKHWKMEASKEPLLITSMRHQSSIREVSFSKDGKSIETSSSDGTLKLWPVATEAAPTWSNKAKFLPNDDDKLFSLSRNEKGDRIIHLWGRKEQRKLKTYPLIGYDKNIPFQWEISSDAQYFVTYSADRVVRVHQLENGDIIKKLSGANYSTDGQSIIGVNEIGEVSVWKFSGELVQHFPTGEKGLMSVQYSQDKQFLIGSTENKFIVWKTTGEFVQHFSEAGIPLNINYSKNEQFIVGTDEQDNVTLWKVTKELIEHLSKDKNTLSIKAVSPYGHYLVTENEGIFEIWDFSGKLVRTIPYFVDKLFFLSDTRHLAFTTYSDNALKIISIVNEHEPITELQGHTNRILGISFSDTGEYIITSSWDKTAKIWTRQGKLVRTLSGHTDEVDKTIFTKDGDILTTSKDGTARIWLSTKKIYEWAKNNKDIYQLTDADRKELGMIEE